MIKARDIMTPDPVVVSPEDEISRATAIMIEQGFNGIPVVGAQPFEVFKSLIDKELAGELPQ